MGPLIFAEIIGNVSDKPWLVMVHGFTQNHRIFDRQAEAFRGRFNLLLVDLRGHGGSGDIDGPFGIEEYTDDLERLLEAHELHDFYYWGTHTGTAVGLVYALRHPGRIRGMILEGTVLPGYPMPRVNELIARARRISAEQGVETAKKDWFDLADWFEQIRNHPVKCRADEHQAIIKEFNGVPWICMLKPREVTDVDRRLTEIDIPILIYNGETDMEDFIRVAQRMKEQKPEIISLRIKQAGAFPCWENPDEVNRVVGEFFNEYLVISLITDKMITPYREMGKD